MARIESLISCPNQYTHDSTYDIAQCLVNLSRGNENGASQPQRHIFYVTLPRPDCSSMDANYNNYNAFSSTTTTSLLFPEQSIVTKLPRTSFLDLVMNANDTFSHTDAHRGHPYSSSPVHSVGSDGNCYITPPSASLSSFQLHLLREHFCKIRTPDGKHLRQISKELGLPRSIVGDWFLQQNRRMEIMDRRRKRRRYSTYDELVE
ncbi:hypothetical protein HDU78_003686 [Chytriomyces hyalinus]|nr:hypothetical protein HDU78_003686 [Chytriomyces hyalinus]